MVEGYDYSEDMKHTSMAQQRRIGEDAEQKRKRTSCSKKWSKRKRNESKKQICCSGCEYLERAMADPKTEWICNNQLIKRGWYLDNIDIHKEIPYWCPLKGA